jgi:4-hydroxy-tetrahydrodipicolinate synthase
MHSGLRGVLPLVPTPFTSDDEVDERSLRRLIEHYVEAGAHGLALLGVASEVHKLDDAERQLVLQVACEQANGRLPMVVGAGAPSTRSAIRWSQAAERAGAAGVLVVPPNAKPTPPDEAIVEYFAAIANSVSIPVIVLDEPSSTQVTLSVSLLTRIADSAGVRSVKVEDIPTVSKMADLQACGFELFGGTGGLYFLEELKQGSSGSMTGFSYIELLVGVYDAWQQGDEQGATRLFDQYLPLIRFEVQPGINLSLRKQVMYWRGLIDTPLVRPPAPLANEATMAQLKSLIERLDLELVPALELARS